MAKRSPTNNIPTAGIGQAIDQLVTYFSNQRQNFERRWYDNNFFDDGFHFKFVSRTTGKIIDLSNNQNVPERAIPKASRQIRGVANLLVNLDPHPVVYPEKVSINNFPNNPEAYLAAKAKNKEVAQKQGYWLEEEWKKQQLKEKMVQMVILAAKHGVSFLQVWPDSVEEKIRTQVYDAFDIYLKGDLTSIYDSPAIIKASPELISVIKANEDFDEAQLSKISPDNKYASSEIKQAYMNSRYGSGMTSDMAATLIKKEAFIKEYLTDDNWEDVIAKGEKNGVMEGKKKGDMVLRHTDSAGGIWLRDEYVDLPDYPFVDYRMEPGQIYQVPLIERFIPANKSLDIVMSRVERYANTMVTGVYQKRKGENYQITNMPGGQVIEYETKPLEQMQMASVPPFMFNYINLLTQNIEEQGASSSALNQLPEGVKSGVAIESVKATEYANLKIPSDMLRDTTKRISEKMLDIADGSFVSPQSVERMDKGNPEYFDVMGKTAMDKRMELGVDNPEGVVPLNKDSRVDIEVESGLGFTMQGKRDTITQLATFIQGLAKEGLVTQEAVQVVVDNLLETFQFGATQEFTEAMKAGIGSTKMSENQLTQMKIAIVEALQDLGIAGPKADEKEIMITKVGMTEVLKESGLAEAMNKPAPTQDKGPSKSISFKDLPNSGKVQLAEQAGIVLDPNEIAQQEQNAKAVVKQKSN